jgi:hypothetical protein
MRTRLAIAIAVGAGFTLLLLALDFAFPSVLWRYLAAPGHIAMIAVWGPHGPIEISEILVVGFGLLTNAIVYGLIAFGVLALLGRRHPRGE